MTAWAFLLFFLILLPSSLTGAEPPEVTFPPVVVTTSRLPDVPEQVTNVPCKVIVVTAEEIDRLGAKTVQEVLQY